MLSLEHSIYLIEDSEAIKTTSIVQEQIVLEIERIYYAKLNDFDQLNKAVKIIPQEQWEYRLYKSGKPIGVLRSRKINHGELFELTVKTYVKTSAGSIESNLKSDSDMHETVKQLSNKGFRKDRYIFPYETSYKGESLTLYWEIDVFYDKDGIRQDWVKIDLEIPKEDIAPPPIPIHVEQIIDASFDKNINPINKQFIDDFYLKVRL